MDAPDPPDTEELLRQADRGDGAARLRLLTRHWARLRRTVAVRLDRRLAGRFDPSGVVQEAVVEAARDLSGYLRDRPLPLYPWLRQFALQRLLQLRRHHLVARRRSVAREAARVAEPGEPSAGVQAELVPGVGTSPSRRLIRDEVRRQVRAAMDRLPPRDREILVLRHVEGKSTVAIGDALGISPGTVRIRHLRALERLRALLDDLP